MFSLTDIEPFNRYFYYNCVHSCLFAIIEANGGDYRKIMISGIQHLAVNRTAGSIYTRFDFLENYSELLLEQGIRVDSIANMDSEKCIRYVKEKIHDNKPVIINVDCFELSYRNDLYHKGEWPHSLLVYGYDKDRDMFQVIDQLSWEDVTFSKFEISSDSLEKAVICFNKNRNDNEMYFGDAAASIECFHEGICYDNDILSECWRQNRKAVQSKILMGIGQAERQMHSICMNMASEEFRWRNGTEILAGLNDVVKQKRWENGMLLELFSPEDELYRLNSELLEQWISVRKKIALMVMSSRPRPKTLEHLKEMLRPLFANENMFASEAIQGEKE